MAFSIQFLLPRLEVKLPFGVWLPTRLAKPVITPRTMLCFKRRRPRDRRATRHAPCCARTTNPAWPLGELNIVPPGDRERERRVRRAAYSQSRIRAVSQHGESEQCSSAEGDGIRERARSDLGARWGRGHVRLRDTQAHTGFRTTKQPTMTRTTT